MIRLSQITKTLLIEQDTKMMVLKKAITKRIPITIDYRGPYPEVESGVRYNIEPVVMGTHIKSGNLVIWAYVYEGTSKKGLPDWKMFRVDRIRSVRFNQDVKQFDPNQLPGFQKGKAPDYMKSLASVITFSPYWFDDREKYKIGRPVQKKPEVQPQIPEPEVQPQVPEPETPPVDTTQPIEKPEMSSQNNDQTVFNSLLPKIQDVQGQKIITKVDFENAVRDLYNKKQGEWKNYQRQLSGNIYPGEGTRRRLDNESRRELSDLLSQNGIIVSDQTLSEQINRIKELIF